MAARSNSAITRRSAISLLLAASAVPPVIRIPALFDAHAYVSELRAAGYLVALCGNEIAFLKASGTGFDRAWATAQLRWSRAMDRCPDCDRQIRTFLMEERA